MLIIIITIIVVLFLSIISYYSFSFTVYKRLVKRGIEKPLNECDLTNTQYLPYIDKLYADMDNMSKKDYVEIEIKSFDNLKLVANYYDNNSGDVALLIHGFKATPLNNFSTIGLELQNRGYSLLMPFLRSHGKSEGKYITYGEKESIDVLSWIDYLDSRDDIKNIIIYGVSLGATTIMKSCDKIRSKKVKKIIFDSGFTNTSKVITDSLKRTNKLLLMFSPMVKLHARVFAKFKLKNEDITYKLNDCPYQMIFVHGMKDKLISYKNSVKAYETKKGENKKLVLIDEAGHNMCFLFDKDKILEAMFDEEIK